MTAMRRVVEGLTEAELGRVCGRKPAEPYPDQEYVVRRCLKVVLKERPSITAIRCATSPCSRPVSEPSEDRYATTFGHMS